MRVLVGCEFSGKVRDAFRRLGHDAVSCDLLETRVPGPHIVGDVLDVLDDGWDLGIFFPPCTYVCSSSLHWNVRRRSDGSLLHPDRQEKTDQAVAFAERLMNCSIPKMCLENPTGCLSTRIRPYDQRIHPHQFGHDASKGTCLWLKGLRALSPLLRIAPRLVEKDGKIYQRWGNQTDSGQNREPPHKDRWARRSETYDGIAFAMAWTWGGGTMKSDRLFD